jgi:DNA polymerase I
VSSFKNIVVLDFEYETSGGEFNLVAGDLPVVLCLVAHVFDQDLRLVRTIRMWRGEFGPMPPFDIGPNTLFVAYSAQAELTCFLTLGWQFPAHIFDLHTAYLAVSNILLPYNPDEVRKRQRKRFPEACRAYGVDGWERIEKDKISKDIGEGRWRDHGKEVVLEYCVEDVRASAILFRKQLEGNSRFKPADVERVIFLWSEYSAKAVARIQAKGMPIDMSLWNLVQENRDPVISYLLRTFDPSFGTANPIYTPDGHWSDARFEAWLVSVGVTAWPRLDSGKIQTDGDAFKIMYHVPGIEELHALKDSLGVIVRAKLPIGRDGRNRPSLFPFCTSTGRNAHARSLFNAHAGMRGFMLFPPDKIPVYLDWRTQEIGVAAALSGDQVLIRDYIAGDVYYALAIMCGLTTDPDLKHWKATQKQMRQRMKSLQLGINYGMGVPSLARGLDRHPVIASAIIEMHKRRYPRYWEWKEERANAAMLERVMETQYGWPMHISNSPNRRTLYNFPMQGNGAEMLRLAATRLCEADIVPNMLVHDAVLLEADNEEQITHAVEIMKGAGRDVCKGLEIGVDVERMKDGRFRDKRPVAVKMWATVMEALQKVGALPEGRIP